MASLLNNDEINKLHKEYFDIMEISDEQKQERIELAELLDDVFFYLFVYIDALETVGKMVIDTVYEIGERRYKEALNEYGIDLNRYPDVDEYVSKMVRNIIDTSVKDSSNGKAKSKGQNNDNNVNNSRRYNVDGNNSGANDSNVGVRDNTRNSDGQGKPKSQAKAIEVAQNEANSIFNCMEYADAVAKGYTKKTWITEGDRRVRPTHEDVDMETIDIDMTFQVGDSLMMFPKDTSMGASAKEIVNCRCSIRYS